MLKLLGLDQAQLSTGWAIGSPDGATPISGVFRSAPWGIEEGRGLCRFSRWLLDTFEQYSITHCIYEEPFIPQNRVVDIDAIKIMLFLEGAINEVCFEGNVEVSKVSINAWRSRFLGRCKAPAEVPAKERTAWFKNEAIAACARHGWLVDDHHAAEARGVMVYGLCDLSADYARSSGPLSRRAELKQMNREFRGE